MRPGRRAAHRCARKRYHQNLLHLAFSFWGVEERQDDIMTEPIANNELDILSIPESEFDFGPEFDDDSDCEI